jgi:hypothetical protein
VSTIPRVLKKRYKPVARKVVPIAGKLPAEYRVERKFPEDPLRSLVPVPTDPPASDEKSFEPGKRLSRERWREMRGAIEKEGFLWEKEIDAIAWIAKQHEMGIAWEDAEKGRFRREYFAPVKIPTIDHVPWVKPNIRIAPGMKEKIDQEVKRKLATGVYEPSNSSYRSSWFTVPKKDGSLRIVHNLEPLNAVTIRDAGVPPIVDEVVEDFANRTCYFYGDLYVGYDERELDEESRDMTTFQAVRGTLRLTTLPMGWTNSPTIFHGDVTFILQDEIPQYCRPFIDDVGVKGPKEYYKSKDGSFETIPENPGIRRFVWEHLVTVNRIMHRIRHAGGTLAAKKLYWCVPEMSILGYVCNFEGRVPDQTNVRKILNWPACANVSEVRGFLGVMGLVRIFVKNFALRAHHLTKLLRNDTAFEWGADQEAAMADLKEAATTAGALVPIDYTSEREVVLAVDSSYVAVGYILGQKDEKGKLRPARYGSITWNPVESRYSQAKIEVYGVVRTLQALRAFLVGVKNLVIEVDAKYIKGMLNKPDSVPSAAINRWIAYIQLYDFELRHVPKEEHKAPDGLSRRKYTEADGAEVTQEEFDEEIDRCLDTYAFLRDAPLIKHNIRAEVMGLQVETTLREREVPQSLDSMTSDVDLEVIKKFLQEFEWPKEVEERDRKRIMPKIRNYFLSQGRMYKRRADGRHQRVIGSGDRYSLMEQAHTELGHKGFYAVRHMLTERVWWPSISKDLKWYLGTCHACQIYNPFQVHIPPTVPEPAPLFYKVHVDTMFMEPSSGYRYIAHARCSMSAWSEWRALRKETGETLGKFLFEMLLCRWGAVPIIVTDNGKPWVKALDWLAKTYRIWHIRISPYNSQAQGIVERQHRTVRDSIVRMCGDNPKAWIKHAPYAFWADRVTVRRSTGRSPFYMAHGCEPILPFDIAEATYLVPGRDRPVVTSELIALRARQLEKRPEDLEKMRQEIWKSRKMSAEEFSRTFAASLRDYNFPRGSLVLIKDSARESDLGKKWKPRYSGPYIVVSQGQNGAYWMMELDGSLFKNAIAEKRVIPYALRSVIDLTRARARLEELEEATERSDKAE